MQTSSWFCSINEINSESFFSTSHLNSCPIHQKRSHHCFIRHLNLNEQINKLSLSSVLLQRNQLQKEQSQIRYRKKMLTNCSY
jgi:hypothetical protein